MKGKCVFVMEYIGYFTFGMHWIHISPKSCIFQWTHGLEQLANGSPFN